MNFFLLGALLSLSTISHSPRRTGFVKKQGREGVREREPQRAWCAVCKSGAHSFCLPHFIYEREQAERASLPPHHHTHTHIHIQINTLILDGIAFFQLARGGTNCSINFFQTLKPRQPARDRDSRRRREQPTFLQSIAPCAIPNSDASKLISLELAH